MANPVYNPNLSVPIGGPVAPPLGGPQTIIVTYPKRSSHREGYKSKLSMICGIVLIVCGVGAIITQSVGFAIQMKKIGTIFPSYRYIGEGYYGWSGVWTSPFVFLTAAFAIVASKTKRVGFIITTLVMSILSAVFVIFVIGLSTWIMHQETRNLNYLTNRYDERGEDKPMMSHLIQASIATAFFMLLCGITEFSCSIFLSCLCCKVLCCSDRQGPAMTNNSQVIFVNNPNVPVASQSHDVTNPETQVFMSPPGYTSTLPIAQASGGSDLPPSYADSDIRKPEIDQRYSEKLPLTN